MDGVKKVFGRRSCFDIAALIGEEKQETKVDLISFDAYDLEGLKKDKVLKKGSALSKVYGDSHYVLAIAGEESGVAVGDKVQIGKEVLEIAGMLQYNPFQSDGAFDEKVTFILSEETYVRVTGVADYSIVMLQTTEEVTNQEVAAIRNFTEQKYQFRDRRAEDNSRIYYAFMLFVYGFLVIITMVSVLNIMNSISMSVSARIKQYGAMRAVGMSVRQMIKMIVAEAFTYALAGCLVGCVAGLAFSRILYDFLIASHFHYAAWRVPILPLGIILFVVFVAAIAAVYAPARRIREMAVTDVINEL